VGPRAGLDATEKRKILPLPRIKPHPSGLQPTDIPTDKHGNRSLKNIKLSLGILLYVEVKSTIWQPREIFIWLST
jgi:hypothetical protein